MRFPHPVAAVRTTAVLALVVLVQLAAAPLLADKAAAAADPAAKRYSLTVNPLLPNGQPAHLTYLTLWRAQQPGEKDPLNTVNGPKGFGYYNPVIWDDEPSGVRWIRARSAQPNDGKHGWQEDTVQFTDLPVGKYRVTAVTYR